MDSLGAVLGLSLGGKFGEYDGGTEGKLGVTRVSGSGISFGSGRGGIEGRGIGPVGDERVAARANVLEIPIKNEPIKMHRVII